MENTIGVSATRTTQDAGNDITLVPDARQPVAYVDLLGVTDWFRANISRENNISNTDRLRRQFEPYLKTLWEWHKPEVTRMSVHPIGDGALIVVKEYPENNVPIEIQEFSEMLADLWIRLSQCGSGDLSPKILISRSLYHTIYLKKDAWDSKHDLYPYLVVPGGLATIRLAGTDKWVPVPAGIYSDLDEYSLNRLAPMKSRVLRNSKWHALQIWDLGLNEPRQDAIEIVRLLTKKCDEYRKLKSYRAPHEWAAIWNAMRIRSALISSESRISQK